MKDELTLAWR